MARDILANGQQLFDGVHFQNPYWIMVTVPYSFADSFDRAKLLKGSDDGFRVVSSSDSQGRASDTYRAKLFDQQIVGWSIQDNKESHVHGMSLELVNQDNNLSLMQWVIPGDWCMFWAFNNRHDYEVIRSRLISKHDCRPWDSDDNDNVRDGGEIVNYYNSGLKFIGTISSIQHHEARRMNGAYDVGWTIQAQAFTELDMTIYYNDLIAFKYANAYQFLPDFGVSLKKFLTNEAGHNQGYVNTNTFVPALIKVALGVGPGELTKDKDQIGKGAKLKSSPNVAFQVPATILSMLGRDDKAFYSDILTQFIGIQTFGPTEKDAFKNVLPDVSQKSDGDGTVWYTKKPIADYFPPDPFSFKDRTIWSFIEGFLNKPLNEAYTAIRPHPQTGRLQPSLIVRRVPYSTDEYADQGSGGNSADFLTSTPFSQVPRWIIAPELVFGFSVGRSDALRFNYVHVVGANFPSKDPTTKERISYILTPPVVDEVSIKRHGLRMMNQKVAGFADPSAATKKNNPNFQYTSFMADILIDSHLRLSGSMTCIGIQDNICPGDNLNFNGVLYHIEAVSHAGRIGAGGEKSFTTSIMLSHGIPLRILGNSGRLQGIKAKEENLESEKCKEFPKDPIDDLQKDLQAQKDPKSDVIYDLRNNRNDLQEIFLVGARTGRESR